MFHRDCDRSASDPKGHKFYSEFFLKFRNSLRSTLVSIPPWSRKWGRIGKKHIIRVGSVWITLAQNRNDRIVCNWIHQFFLTESACWFSSWELADERIEICWLASMSLLDKIMRAISDSGNALLLWYFILAMAAANRDSKLRKLSLLLHFSNKSWWKSL